MASLSSQAALASTKASLATASFITSASVTRRHGTNLLVTTRFRQPWLAQPLKTKLDPDRLAQEAEGASLTISNTVQNRVAHRSMVPNQTPVCRSPDAPHPPTPRVRGRLTTLRHRPWRFRSARLAQEAEGASRL